VIALPEVSLAAPEAASEASDAPELTEMSPDAACVPVPDITDISPPFAAVDVPATIEILAPTSVPPAPPTTMRDPESAWDDPPTEIDTPPTPPLDKEVPVLSETLPLSPDPVDADDLREKSPVDPLEDDASIMSTDPDTPVAAVPVSTLRLPPAFSTLEPDARVIEPAFPPELESPVTS
jgi:hypothetical protein